MSRRFTLFCDRVLTIMKKILALSQEPNRLIGLHALRCWLFELLGQDSLPEHDDDSQGAGGEKHFGASVVAGGDASVRYFVR